MVDVACSYNMNCPTISTIQKNKIMAHVKSALLMMFTTILKKCRKVVEMKKLLSVWKQDQHPLFSPAQLTAALRESLKPL